MDLPFLGSKEGYRQQSAINGWLLILVSPSTGLRRKKTEDIPQVAPKIKEKMHWSSTQAKQGGKKLFNSVPYRTIVSKSD